MGSNIKSIGSRAFQALYDVDGIVSLTNITINTLTPPSIGFYIFDIDASNRSIYVPSGKVDTYKNAFRWDAYETDIVSQ